jgi:16S rRNA (uracil1498-N3)-methyltransferase
MSAVKKFQNRIYLKNNLTSGSLIELSKYHFQYLAKVLRLRVGEHILVFNEQDGEWAAQIHSIDRNTIWIKLNELLRKAPKVIRKLTLLFAPVKNPNASFYVQKATELGVDSIIPLLTNRSIIQSFKPDRFEQVAIEASEQCGRMTIPKVHDMMRVERIHRLQCDKILFCDEKEKNLSILDAMPEEYSEDNAILIGPEGGFDDEERKYLYSLPEVIPVTLGPNILRAETAMVAALSAYALVANLKT